MIYNSNNLEDAVQAVRSSLMGFKKASKVYWVPKTTTVDHICNHFRNGSKLGRPRVLDVKTSNKGFDLSTKQLLLKLSQVCKSLNIKFPFAKGVQG